MRRACAVYRSAGWAANTAVVLCREAAGRENTHGLIIVKHTAAPATGCAGTQLAAGTTGTGTAAPILLREMQYDKNTITGWVKTHADRPTMMCWHVYGVNNHTSSSMRELWCATHNIRGFRAI